MLVVVLNVDGDPVILDTTSYYNIIVPFVVVLWNLTYNNDE